MEAALLFDLMIEQEYLERRRKAAVQRVRRLLHKEEGRAISVREIAERCKLTESEALVITEQLVSSPSFRYGRS